MRLCKFQTLMVALRVLLCAVVTYSAPIFLDNEWSCIVFRSWWWRLASTFVELSQNPRAYALTMGMCVCVIINITLTCTSTARKRTPNKKSLPGFFKKTAIHKQPHRYIHDPRNPQLQCCAWKCRTPWTEMVVFFEGRQTHNSEYNIELGDGGDITSMVFYFIGWLFFLKNPDSEQT